MKQIKKAQRIGIILLISFLSLSTSVSAASLILKGPSSVAENSELMVDVLVGADGQSVNAFEGSIVFPNALLTVKEIKIGDSVINFWVEEPHVTTLSSSPNSKTGLIPFSGITPGGFHGLVGPYAGEKPGKLFTIIFYPRGQGSGQITSDNIRILREDGEGTEVDTIVSPLYVEVIEKTGEEDNKVVFRDLNPPENFHPEIGQDESLFSNNYFLVFMTNDKESGIGHYEVMETEDKSGKKGEWVVASSPHELKDQSLSKYIFVKAIDKSNNERIEMLSPTNLPSWNRKYWVLVIIIAVVAAILWLKRRRHRFFGT